MHFIRSLSDSENIQIKYLKTIYWHICNANTKICNCVCFIRISIICLLLKAFSFMSSVSIPSSHHHRLRFVPSDIPKHFNYWEHSGKKAAYWSAQRSEPRDHLIHIYRSPFTVAFAVIAAIWVSESMFDQSDFDLVVTLIFRIYGTYVFCLRYCYEQISDFEYTYNLCRAVVSTL